jgi:thymidylate synthase (FAD)
MTIELRSDIKVEYVHGDTGDETIATAAWISTENEPKLHDEGRIPGLINYLIEHRHGTPFEHNSLTFRVEAPIMVFREWHRHRIQSYNEQSGRYTQFLPNFYVPSEERPLVNSGSSARPKFTGDDPEGLHEWFTHLLLESYEADFDRYQQALDNGISNEMARLLLPVATYSSMYATANLRAWLHFISLRTSEENAHWKGHPQYEIVQAAKAIEEKLRELFPLTLAAFDKHGRVAP